MDQTTTQRMTPTLERGFNPKGWERVDVADDTLAFYHHSGGGQIVVTPSTWGISGADWIGMLTVTDLDTGIEIDNKQDHVGSGQMTPETADKHARTRLVRRLMNYYEKRYKHR